MKTQTNNKILRSLKIAVSVAIVAGLFQNCTKGMDAASPTTSGNQSSGGGGGGGGTVIDPVVAGNGANFSGNGALSVATTDGLVQRIKNGLENNANPLAGNFATSLVQVKSNLPKVSDPTKATGYDQGQLLIYAACSDLTTGGTPLMQSKYNVTANGTIAANQAALVAAGVRMIDAYTAGMATQGPTSAQVSQAFTDLVTKTAATNTNTSKIAFMSVCIAANTAGSLLLGF